MRYFDNSSNFIRFFLHSPAGLIFSEADTGKMVEVNDSFCSMVGHDKDYLLGKTSIEAGILTMEQRRMLVDTIKKEGRLLNFEFPIRNRRNEELWILMSVDVIEISGKRYHLTTTFDITKGKNEQQALAASETRYHSIFENSLAGIIVSEIDTFKVLDANTVAAKMLGYESKDDFLRNYDAKRHYVNPSDQDQIRDRLLKEPELSNSVLALRKVDGTPVYLKIFAKTERAISSRVTVIIDATNELLQFYELEKSREHYKLMFENMREAFTVMEPITDSSGSFIDARFIEINPAAERAIGKPRKDLIGRLRSETLGPFSAERISHFNSVLQSGEQVSEEVYYEHPGKWMEGRTYMQDGRMISIAFDITKRKAAEQRLEEEWTSTQFLNDALFRLWDISTTDRGLEEILLTSIALSGADKGSIQLLDPKKDELLIAAHKGLGKEFLEHFGKVSPDSGSVCARALASRSQVVAHDVQHDSLFAGHHRVFSNEGIGSVQSTPIFSHSGEPIGMISTHSSKTANFSREALRRMELYARYAESFLERMRIHDELNNLNHELENKVRERTSELSDALREANKVSEMKSRFVATASHEFRTPLATILSSVFLAQKFVEAGQTEKSEKHFKRIQSSVKVLTDILNDFLSLEKLEQGKVFVEKTSFNIKHLLKEVADELTMMCKDEQSIVFGYKGQEEIFQDKRIIRNVVLNLLSNAIKYSSKNVDLLAERSGRQLKITVKDQGIGIPAADQERIFTKFFRATNAINIQGTGLGLNILRHYLELLGGNIDFASREGEGTSFTVTFPIR